MSNRGTKLIIVEERDRKGERDFKVSITSDFYKSYLALRSTRDILRDQIKRLRGVKESPLNDRITDGVLTILLGASKTLSQIEIDLETIDQEIKEDIDEFLSKTIKPKSGEKGNNQTGRALRKGVKKALHGGYRRYCEEF